MNYKLNPKRGVRLVAGSYVIATILALFIGRFVWNSFNSSRNTRQLAKELSSMYVIQKTPAVSHSGQLIGLIHTTEGGVGVFIQNIATKSEQKICEVSDIDYKASGAWTFGWSPNDETLAYSWDRTIHFVGRDGNESHGSIEGITNHFQSFAWLTPDRCAYIDDLPRIGLLERIAGKWTTSRFFDLNTTNGNPRSIRMVNEDVVAWHTDSHLWNTDLNTGETKPVYTNRRRRLDDFSYASTTGSYMLVESTNKGRACFLVQVSNTNGLSVVRQLTQKPSIQNVRWINDGRGYVYLSRREDEATLFGAGKVDDKEKMVLRAGQILNMSCDGRDALLYLIGSKSSEPTAVWQCDAVTGEMRSVASPYGGSHFPFRPVVYQAAPYGNRNSAQYEFVPPVNFLPGKKYPLLIALGGYEWSPIAHAIYAQCLANDGAFVAFVNYRWNQRQPETIYNHTNNVLAVYNHLIANPSIDTNRVFLAGFSAGTLVVSELVKQYPERWKGIMLLNPSFLPEPQAGMTLSVLVTAGSDEGGEERFRPYQEKLAKVGIPMEWHIHEGSQHVPRNQQTMYERTLWMSDMIFEK